MFKIYGTPTCQWCKAAKELLTSRGEKFKYIELDNSRKLEEFQNEFPGAKTVPQIITPDGRKIGGYDALLQMLG